LAKQDKKETERLYSEEISLTSHVELSDYVQLNLRKIGDYRRAFNIPVIGIAGTEGKTTTKRMLSAILSQRGNVLETSLDCSTASGVTSTLLNLSDQHDYAILELGILNQKQFELAVKVSQPTIGVVTNIGEAHLATLGDKYLIADAKVELVRNLPKDGFAVLNKDDDLVSDMAKFCPSNHVVKFGFNSRAHFFANRIQYLGPEGIQFCVNGYYPFHLQIYGSASIYNALAAVSVARILGVGFEEMRSALEKFQLTEHRGNLIRASDVYFLDHTYDATINSVTKACESLVQFRSYSSKLILVLGDVGNPGESPVKTHLNLGYYISALPIDAVITYGQLAAYAVDGILKINHTRKEIAKCQEPDELIQTVLNSLQPGATVLAIGRKPQGLSDILQKIIDAL